jgi:hypothetical protein
MPKSDGIAVVDVSDGHADDIWPERASFIAGARNAVPREAKVEESHAMPGFFERGSNARQPVGHDRVGLSLAIGTHEQDSRPVVPSYSSIWVHRSIA